MMPKAILLDLDDTIIAHDYGIDTYGCWKTACRTHLPDWDEARVDAAIQAILQQARWYWSDRDRHRIGRMDLDKARAEIIEGAFLNLGQPSSRELCERIAFDNGVERDRAIDLYPGAIDTLLHLKQIGIKLALLTNGSTKAQRRKIDRFGLAPYFDCIFVEEEFGVGKPDARVYEQALRQLGVDREDAWMVGDNFEWEIVAPQRIGIKGIWVNPHKAEHPSTAVPYRTIATLSELKSLLERE
ncbi:MAG: phosphoglycolate phosphatase [Paenibacillus sp.]|jgi:putative hydrolase of the HAD superfamily|nr:phosphoglycolate phosphatase [Paenibacillus sp.]